MSKFAQHWGLLGVSAALFTASAATTVLWCGSMSAMPGMEMPGGWTMSMAWMRMPGQSWPGAVAAFLGMRSVMMIAMMLPSLVPMLMRYRAAVATTSTSTSTSTTKQLARLTSVVAAGYYFVWILAGVAAYPIGLALAATEMHLPSIARAVPIATGMVVMFAGALQFTAWKAHQLACCRSELTRPLPAEFGTAWHHGLRLGLDCVHCCAGLTAVLLVLGVMDLRAMLLVTLAITLERLSPAAAHVARGLGAIAIASGSIQLARAIVLQ